MRKEARGATTVLASRSTWAVAPNDAWVMA
jgi:hypothetical protein